MSKKNADVEMVVPRSYGEVYRELRDTKGYLAKQAHQEDCDRKTLWNFELGERGISLETFVKLLENINVSAAEFFAAVNNHQLGSGDLFFERVHESYVTGDVEDLKEILNEKKIEDGLGGKINKNGKAERDWHIFVLSGMINNLDPSFAVSESVVENSLDYLLAIETWLTCDIWYLAIVVHFVNVTLSCSIVRGFVDSDEVFLVGVDRKRRFLSLLMNTAHYAIEKNLLVDAKFFLNAAETLMFQQGKIPFHFIGDSLALKFAQGEYQFLCGDKEGIDQMKAVIEQLAFLGQEEWSCRYKKYMGNIIFEEGGGK